MNAAGTQAESRQAKDMTMTMTMNKKIVYAVGAVALLGAGYAGASWYAGNQIAAALDANASALSQFPIIKVVKRDLQTSVFSSVENVTYQIGCETGLDESNPLHGNLGTLTLKNTISHQPFNLTINTAIQYDEKTRAELAKIFKDKEPLSIRTQLGLNGQFHTEMTSPAFILDTEEGRFESKGLSADVKSDRDLSFVDSHIKYAGLSLVKGDEELAVGEVVYQSNAKKAAEGLYAGKNQMTIAALSLRGNHADKPFDMNVGKSDFSSDTQIDGGFMRSGFKGQVNDMVLNTQKIGSLNLDAALEHLDAKAIQAINQAFGMQGMLQCKNDPAAQMKVLQAQAQALLEKDPKYSQKVSLKTPEGESVFALQLQGKGVTKADLASPDLLRNKLDASLSVQVPQALIERLIADVAQADALESTLANFQNSLSMGVEQGFVVSDGKLIKAHFTAQQGKTVLNGKPFDLMQLMGGH
jgi:uncharacterized protein YdgA (DUF945 family)